PEYFGLVIAGNVAAIRQDGDDVGERKADLSYFFGQVEQAAEPPVPDGQAIGTVEHRDPLVHLRERRLQHVLIVLQRLAGLVEEPGGIRVRVLRLLQYE